MGNILPELNVAQLDYALSYPYDRPDHSYCLDGSAVVDLPIDISLSGRIPVIACGSNAAPSQLIRKFDSIRTDPIYVTKARLDNFLCCYSAHITSYGSIPATLAYIQGTSTDCHITWLTEQQLDHMHKTEAVGKNYRYSRLEKLDLLCEVTGLITAAYSYVSLFGSLLDSGIPIAVSGIKATPPPLLQLNQTSMQEKILAKTAPNLSVTEFVFSNISNSQLRRDRVDLIKQNTKAFSYPYEKVVLT